MPHVGALKQATTYRFELAGGSAAGGVTAFTIRRDRISEVETFPAMRAAEDRTINQGVARIIFTVTPAVGQPILFKVSQGTLMVEETCNADTQFVFDVV